MDLPVGPPAPTDPALWPSRIPLNGRYTSVVPLEPNHAGALYKHLGGEDNFYRWTYMFLSGFANIEECEVSIRKSSEAKDPHFFAVLTGPASDPASEPAGMMSFLNIVPDHLRIEIGSVILGGQLQKSRAATEAFFLMIQHAFEDLRYHRVEWKANNLNKASLSAARRLGFVFEGVFRKHMVIKGRWRDTAWFSMTKEEWPAAKKGFETWLRESNFDAAGKQRRGLGECRANPE
ncbi:hypothetical protein jhhlp_004264 [Lomentospora prolificans]|uniref:N-acetyltransferase domain-containing protein n=1 Tax=Lomentospora prolificans TaxID=41688 RepID=A0A2N3NB10_9PEZI|nr:hypothetical protein jhhlp_004264 [Lomentospora prolificans]